VILTVNANAALDRVIFIERFEPTTVMRASRVVDSVGGKGLDATVVLQTIGAPNIAISFMAGPTGQVLTDLMDDYGIHHDLVWVNGDTRIANVIVEKEFNRHSHIMTIGYSVNANDCRLLLQKVLSHAPGADWMILAGSLPGGASPNLFAKAIQIGKQYSVRCLIDSPGVPTRKALRYHPDIVKLNRDEFADTFDIQADSVEGLITPVRKLMTIHEIGNVVVTAGTQGILAVTSQKAYLAQAPQQIAVNAAGAGDSVSAVLAHQLSLGSSWEEALRLAAATSAAVVLTEGTADCRIEDIHRICPQVHVKTL
jgi:1-phosphofructokinase family hexose kinase